MADPAPHTETPGHQASEGLHEAAPGVAEAAGAAHGEGGGLPQFEFAYWGGQIVWLLLIFVVLYALLSRVFLPRLRGVLDERARTIAEAVEEARKVQAEAQAQAEAARNEIAEARAHAQRTAAAAKAEIAQKTAARQAEQEEALAARIAKAEAAIRKTREKAMTNVGAIAADTVQAVVERLSGDAVTPAQAEDAVRAVQGAA